MLAPVAMLRGMKTSAPGILIYGLVDPTSDELRYIGQTSRPTQRLGQHLRTARQRSNLHVAAWIRGLLDREARPEIVPIEKCDRADADDSEQFWIEYFRSLGCRLTNRSIGGKAPRGWHHSEEQKAKWRRERRGENAPRYGKPASAEQRNNQSLGQKRRYETEVHPRLGKKHSEETRKLISENRSGVVPKMSEQGRKNHADALKRRWADPAWRKRFSELTSGDKNPRFGKRPPDHQLEAARKNIRRGFKHKPETIEKMRAAALRRSAA